MRLKLEVDFLRGFLFFIFSQEQEKVPEEGMLTWLSLTYKSLV